MLIARKVLWKNSLLFILSYGMSLVLATSVAAQGDDGGKFDGALWRFSMTSKTPGLKSVGGRFRVQGNTLYQKESPDDKEFKKVVGKKVAGRDGKVRVEFTDFRTSTEPGAPPIHVQGTALLSFDKFGNWSGRFIDSTGRHWEFQCERVQE